MVEDTQYLEKMEKVSRGIESGGGRDGWMDRRTDGPSDKIYEDTRMHLKLTVERCPFEGRILIQLNVRFDRERMRKASEWMRKPSKPPSRLSQLPSRKILVASQAC